MACSCCGSLYNFLIAFLACFLVVFVGICLKRAYKTRGSLRIVRALGLLQGGRALYGAGFFENTLELNFGRRDLIRPLGPIYAEDSNCAEFLRKYLSYEHKLTGTALNRYRLAVNYILDGLAGPVPLENRVISLYTAIEIVDQSRTMSKNSLVPLLAITTVDAELCVNIRHKLIHEGEILYKSIESARSALQSRGRLCNMPFRFTGITQQSVVGNFHVYLAERLLGWVSREIGMTTVPELYEIKYL
jgi:hypothetical protein